jgi:hypothetical protein
MEFTTGTGVCIGWLRNSEGGEGRLNPRAGITQQTKILYGPSRVAAIDAICGFQQDKLHGSL